MTTTVSVLILIDMRIRMSWRRKLNINRMARTMEQQYKWDFFLAATVVSVDALSGNVFISSSSLVEAVILLAELLAVLMVS